MIYRKEQSGGARTTHEQDLRESRFERDERDKRDDRSHREDHTGGPGKTNVLKTAGQNFIKHKTTQMAAALAFYSIFSLGPILIILISIAGLVWGEQAVRGEIVASAGDAVGEDTAQMLQTVLANAADVGQGVIGLIIGIVTLIIGATVVLAQLKDSLNTIWQVKAKSGRPVMTIIRDRGLALLLILFLGAVLAASLIAGSLATGMAERFASPIVVQALELLLSLLVITLVFAVVFRYLPDGRISWSNIWIGAAVTAVLFVLGKFGLGIYLGQAGVASAYGVAGGLILLLLFVYYSAMIFLFGAEFTYAWAESKGERPEPSAVAERA